MSKKVGNEIHQLGWQSGSVLSPGHIQSLDSIFSLYDKDRFNYQPEDWLVLVSQTCDIVVDKLEAEPYVEVLLCRPIKDKKPRSQFSAMKSTRVIDFRPNKDTHEALILSAHATRDRFCIPREALLNKAPDQNRQLSSEAIRNIGYWYALRYSRPAWPNQLVKRFQTAVESIIEILRPLSDEIAEVRISIEQFDRDLDLNEDYNIIVYFVVAEEIWNREAELREQITKAYWDFVNTVKSCIGISVNEEFSGVFPGNEFTWELTQSTDLWNFANLTHSE